MTLLATLLLLIFPVAMAFAAANDLFTMKIPNRVSIALVLGFVGVAMLTHMPLETFATNIGIGAAVLVVTFILFSLNLFGGGDAKLIAAAAIWVGANHSIEFLAYVAVLGGVLSILILGYRNLVPADALPLPDWARRLHTPRGPIPYGIAIAAAGLLVFPSTDLFRSLMV